MHLLFMPWCYLNKEYSVGEITLIPYEVKKGIEKFDEKTNKRIRKVVESYKKKDGETVGQITILKV